MNEDSKKKNRITVIIILAMLAIAAVVIVIVRGIPEVKLDGGYSELREVRDEVQVSLLGEWRASDDENFVVDIWRDGEGLFHAIVNISQKEGEVVFYEMSGDWQDFDAGFKYSDCKKTVVTYDEDETAHTNEIYSDGTGSMNLKDGRLVWTDKKEKTGDNVIFDYVGEY